MCWVALSCIFLQKRKYLGSSFFEALHTVLAWMAMQVIITIPILSNMCIIFNRCYKHKDNCIKNP